MRTLLWETVLLGLTAVLTWWFFLRPQPDLQKLARLPEAQNVSVVLTPMLAPPAPEPTPEPAAEPETAAPSAIPAEQDSVTSDVSDLEPPPAEEESLPPNATRVAPPEVGVPEGEELAELSGAGVDAENGAQAATGAVVEAASVSGSEELMQDAELLSAATDELADTARQGFATVLLASPEEQLEIARFFGEELVLIPKTALDPRDTRPRYFRIDDSFSGVEAVEARPPFERFRQYRDLFDYEYARLPKKLRELRKTVLARNEVYLFAALIPVREWAVVVGRRREALALAGRQPGDVRRFLMRYEELVEGGFDFAVEEIVFTDGEHFRPPRSTSATRPPAPASGSKGI